MSRPWRSRWPISFWDWETTTAMSVDSISSMRLASHGCSSWQGIVLGSQLGPVFGPRLLHVVVHPHGGGLVEPVVHGLAGEPAAHDVPHEILGHRAQAPGPGQQRVLPTEPSGQLTLG